MQRTIELQKTPSEIIAENAIQMADKVEDLYEKIVKMKSGQHENWTVKHENGFQPVHSVEVSQSSGETIVYSFLERIEEEEKVDEEEISEFEEEPPIMVIIEKKTPDGKTSKLASFLSKRLTDISGTKIRSSELEEKDETFIISQAEDGTISLTCNHKNGNKLIKGPAAFEAVSKKMEKHFNALEKKQDFSPVKAEKIHSVSQKVHQQIDHIMEPKASEQPAEVLGANEEPDSSKIIQQNLKLLEKLIRKNKATVQHVMDTAERITQLEDQNERDAMMLKLLRMVRISHDPAIHELIESIEDLALRTPESPSENEIGNSLYE